MEINFEHWKNSCNYNTHQETACYTCVYANLCREIQPVVMRPYEFDVINIEMIIKDLPEFEK